MLLLPWLYVGILHLQSTATNVMILMINSKVFLFGSNILL